VGYGTVREDYSEDGNAWDYFTHDQARSRAYKWGEDGLGGGNAKKLTSLPQKCRMGDNANAFLGGFRLWEKGGGRHHGSLKLPKKQEG